MSRWPKREREEASRRRLEELRQIRPLRRKLTSLELPHAGKAGRSRTAPISELDYIPVTESGCWLWLGALSKGYGEITIQGKSYKAHRVSYEQFDGPIPEGKQLDHLCRVRCCINPSHLEPVTAVENVMRGEGPTAVHARKTHCKNGHPLSGDNVKIVMQKGNGRVFRDCKECDRNKYNSDAWRHRYRTDVVFREKIKSRARQSKQRKRSVLAAVAA